jgi:putative exosortase-associated protein (TIGR04073 family)
MNTYHRFFVAGLLTSLSLGYTPTVLADEVYQPQYQQQYQPSERSYGEKVGDKTKNGLTNITTSWLEVPKSIINNTNAEDSNIIFGLVGGVIEGVLNTAGRTTAGVADLVTAPLATKPIIQPRYIWEDFDEISTYGKVFRLDSDEQSTVTPPR